MATIFETIENLGKIITDAVSAGNDENIPARSIRKTLIKVSTGQYREVLPIIVPAECCVMGDELRSTNVQPRKESNSKLTPKSDFKYSALALKRVEEIISDVVEGSPVQVTANNNEFQDQTWPFSEAPQVADAARLLTRSIRKSIDVSLGEKYDAELTPAYELTDPNFGYSRDLNLLNREFIQAEVIAFIKEEYPNLKYSKTKCKQDVGFIIDAVAYDLTYGGNWQSVKAGEAYYEGANFNIAASEKQATLDAYNYLKALLQTVGRNITVTPVFQTEVEQIPGTGGTLAVSNVINDLLDDIINIVDNGLDSVSIDYPSVLESPNEEVDASDALVLALPQIQQQTIDFINQNFGSFKFDSAKYRTDFTNVIEDLAFDAVFDTNYNAIFAGTVFNKSYNLDFLQGQRVEFVGAIRNLRDQILALSAVDSNQSIKTRVRNSFDEIVEIIRNGLSAADQISFVNPVGVVQDKIDAKNNIRANIDFITQDVISFINNQIQENTVANPDPLSIWFEFDYDEDFYRTEIGYVLDALSYDVLYGGTQAVTKLTEAYFFDSTNIFANQEAQVSEAYSHLSNVVQEVVQEIDVSEQSGNTEIQTQLGSPASATEASEIIANMGIITNALDDLNLENVPAVVFPDITSQTTAQQNAKNAIDTNRNSIVKNTIQFVTNEYSDFNYNHDKCSRDIELLVEAARYDWMLDTNYASIIAAYSYLRKPSAKVIGNQKDATIAANEYAKSLIVDNVNGVIDAVRSVNNSWQYINDIIWSASSEGNVDQVDFIENYNATRMLELNKEFIVKESKEYVDEWFFDVSVSEVGTNNVNIADTSWLHPNMPIIFYGDTDEITNAGIDPLLDYFVKDIVSSTAFTVSNSIGGTAYTFIPNNAPFNYDKEKYRQQLSLLIEGVVFDSALGTNYNSVTRGILLNENYSDSIIQIKDSIEFAQIQTEDIRSVKTNVNALQRVSASFNEAIDILENGEGNANTLTFPIPANATLSQQNAVSQLIANRSFLQEEYIAYINNNYSGLTYNSELRKKEAGYLIDALCYDLMYGSNVASGQIATIYIEDGSLILTNPEKTAIVDALDYLATIAGQVVIETDVNELQGSVTQDFSNEPASATEVSRIETLLQITEDVITAESLVVIDEPIYPKLDGIETQYESPLFAVLTEKENIVIKTARYFDRQYSTLFKLRADYDYDETICSRDVRAYIDAIKWDLIQPKQWERKYTDGITLYRPAFYKSKLAGRYYTNSVLGSQEEDFFYLRNGTGLRLMSLDGLNGDLGPANEFGTSRPTAGAYASLDPGFGPEDSRVWITARSPYVQNVSTFGYAATGQRIDGALHNGGNDSIVSNDFTQVISDGIGAHILNNGRAELVSVFTYYAHVGYLAETGGRIRATNGNCSYGSFGAVAEGVDPEETPVTAVVDNRTQYNATISNVFTDQNEILQLEFDHAGNEYTEAELDIFGAGDSEELIADEFRDQAVNRVRIAETTPDTAGGSGYTLVSNTAQTGTTSALFLAATDGNLSSAYPGMSIYITAGAATGQYGTIYTYNSGSKEATVIRPASLTPVNASAVSNGTIYRIEEAGDTDWNSISDENLIDPRPGTVFTANTSGSGTGTAIEMESGWEHIIPGTPISAPNSSSTYQIEPRAHITAPANSFVNNSNIAADTWNSISYFETAQQYINVQTSTNADGRGASFDVTRIGSKYYLTINNAGSGYVRLDTLTISGDDVGGVTPNNDITVTITSLDQAGSIIDFDFEGLAQKGLFVAVPNGNSAQTSINGSTWSSVSLNANRNWSDVTTGLLDDGSSLFKPSAAIVVNDDDDTVAFSSDGLNWNIATTGLPAGNTSIAFGNVAVGDNKFIVVSSASQDVAYTVDGGTNWDTFAGVLPSTGISALTFGKGNFVAVAGGTNTVYYSADAQLWTTGNLPSTSNWKDITWGNGRFVALHDNGVAYSYDLENWFGVILPTGGIYNQIAYGQGIFVATRDDNTVVFSEDGVLWSTFSVGANADGYNAIAHGNPGQNTQFVAIGGGTADTEVSVIEIGARAKGRAGVANEQLFEIRITEPGSGYNTEPAINIFDPNNITDVELDVRLGNGALANPTFVSRGSSFTTATAEINDLNSNGFADFFQDGSFVAVRRLSERPVNGSNVVFDSLPNQVFKLVNTVSFVGTNEGSFVGFLQISPEMSIADAPVDGDDVTLRIRYSQVRASSHDFLDVGTGNFVDTNYPGIPVNDPDPSKETNEFDGGRVFFTATDQDGNFRVGDLFSIEQATGVATLNAEAFNIAGLQELTLGEVTLGGNSASVTEFSTDPFFTANSDSVVPTQRAVKAYIEAQIGGGGASLNVNSVTAGDIFINTNQITTVSGEQINIKANVNFEGAVLGLPLAYNYFFR